MSPSSGSSGPGRGGVAPGVSGARSSDGQERTFVALDRPRNAWFSAAIRVSSQASRLMSRESGSSPSRISVARPARSASPGRSTSSQRGSSTIASTSRSMRSVPVP